MGLPPDLVELFEGGASIVIGTRDAKLHPEVARACGASVAADGRKITVFLASSVADRTLANLADNGHIAVSFTDVFSHRSIQTKGRVSSATPAAEIQHDIITRYAGAWAQVLYVTGIPRAVTLQLATWPAMAITFDVENVFVQTPGPKAGRTWATGER